MAIGTNTRRAHPLILVAAAALTLFAAIGSAALLGWLPTPRSETDTSSLATAASAPQPVEAVAPITPVPVAPKARAIPPRPAMHAAEVPATPTVRRVSTRPLPAAAQHDTRCRGCGTVESVREVDEPGEGSGLGAVIGGVTGGIVGRQFGGGRGRDLMTVIGAIGGGVAGHQIEKRARATTHEQVMVRFDDGSSGVFDSEQTGLRSGDRVRLIDGRLSRML